MKSQRPATVAHVLDSLEGGGTERHLVSLLAALPPGPTRHVVVTLRAAGSLAERLPASVACRALGITEHRVAFPGLARALREFRADIVHARNTGTWFDAAVAARLAGGARLVLGFHGLETGDTFSPRQIRKARIGALAGARFTTVGQAGAGMLLAQAGVDPARITVLPNGVDLERFRPRSLQRAESIRGALGFAQDDVVIGAVGSLTPIKRLDRLLDAASALRLGDRRPRVLLVGSGPLRDALCARAEALGIRADLCLAGTRADVGDMLAAMDVFVSCSESEGMSNALLEALAAGRPVVTTPVGEHPALIRNGVDGLVTRDQSPEAIAEAVASILTDPGRPRSLRAAARARAEGYGLELAAARYARYYDDLLPPGTRTPTTGRERREPAAPLASP